MLNRTLVLLLGMLSAPAFAATPGDDVLGRDLAASCGACHGTNGVSHTDIPSLAGVARETLVEKLKGFAGGSVPASVMHQHAKGYSDDEIRLIAEFFARQATGK